MNYVHGCETCASSLGAEGCPKHCTKVEAVGCEGDDISALAAELKAAQLQLGELKTEYLKEEAELDRRLLQVKELKEAVNHAKYCDYAGSEIEFKCPECEKFNGMEKRNHEVCSLCMKPAP